LQYLNKNEKNYKNAILFIEEPLNVLAHGSFLLECAFASSADFLNKSPMIQKSILIEMKNN
jgi:hypothetical protein